MARAQISESGLRAEITDENLRAFTGYTMKRAFNVLSADLQRSLAPHGLRMMTFSALAMIEENPGLRPSQLAEALMMERANLVVILGELTDRGLVCRTQSAEDRRAFALHLTEAGATAFAAARKAAAVNDARVQASLDADERSALRAALRQIEAWSEGKT